MRDEVGKSIIRVLTAGGWENFFSSRRVEAGKICFRVFTRENFFLRKVVAGKEFLNNILGILQ